MKYILLVCVSSQGEIGTCKALFEFEGEGDGELSFVRGDVISILEEVDADWTRGRLGDKEGIFPKSFVEVVSKIPKTSQIKSKPLTPTSESGRDCNGVVGLVFSKRTCVFSGEV